MDKILKGILIFAFFSSQYLFGVRVVFITTSSKNGKHMAFEYRSEKGRALDFRISDDKSDGSFLKQALESFSRLFGAQFTSGGAINRAFLWRRGSSSILFVQAFDHLAGKINYDSKTLKRINCSKDFNRTLNHEDQVDSLNRSKKYGLFSMFDSDIRLDYVLNQAYKYPTSNKKGLLKK